MNWLKTAVWIDENLCKSPMDLNRFIARFRLRKWRSEFSTWMFRYCLISWRWSIPPALAVQNHRRLIYPWLLQMENRIWKAVSLILAKYCAAISAFWNIAFQHCPFMIDGAPEVEFLTVDFDKNLINVPTLIWVMPCPMMPSFFCKQEAKTVPP